MEGNSFRTLGECEFGTVWFVEGEGKVVVNAYQAALYFSVDDFMNFALMVADARKKMSSDKEPSPPPPAPTNSKIRQFRPAQSTDD
jgi:hypothetical protein